MKKTLTIILLLTAFCVGAYQPQAKTEIKGTPVEPVKITEAIYQEDYKCPIEPPSNTDGAVALPEWKVTYDPLDKTNLTGVQLETLAPGLGEALYKMEQKHGVNAIFCLSVGWVESGWKHTAARNNYWGITKVGGGFRSWDSLESAIDGFGAYMNQKMYHGKPIEQVAKIYCPPTWQKWAGDVRAAMAGYFSEVE
ncbi:MAG: glucosaminidase domain-containing protein [Tissierellia bacterium]|nr:glucosaminidase domain-containing protein [Tissierellia bacterium]